MKLVYRILERARSRPRYKVPFPDLDHASQPSKPFVASLTPKRKTKVDLEALGK
jgi:hypothetical protein